MLGAISMLGTLSMLSAFMMPGAFIMPGAMLNNALAMLLADNNNSDAEEAAGTDQNDRIPKIQVQGADGRGHSDAQELGGVSQPRVG